MRRDATRLQLSENFPYHCWGIVEVNHFLHNVPLKVRKKKLFCSPEQTICHSGRYKCNTFCSRIWSKGYKMLFCMWYTSTYYIVYGYVYVANLCVQNISALNIKLLKKKEITHLLAQVHLFTRTKNVYFKKGYAQSTHAPKRGRRVYEKKSLACEREGVKRYTHVNVLCEWPPIYIPFYTTESVLLRSWCIDEENACKGKFKEHNNNKIRWWVLVSENLNLKLKNGWAEIIVIIQFRI